MLPMFLAAADQTLLATATPVIASELGGLRDTSWIAVGYLLAATVTIPLYGRLGDRLGRRNVLVAALGLFALGSLLCGVAQSLPMLVGARIMQGLGGGGLMSLSQALIGELVEPRQRARYQGYFAAIFTLSSIAGPVVGGLVVSVASWRWLFLANLPLCLFAAWRLSLLPASAGRADAPGFSDKAGLVLFSFVALGSLLWLTSVGHRFAWSSPTGWGGLLLAAALWSVLVRRELHHPSPFLPVELLRNPAIGMMSLTVILFAACLFSLVFFIPIYLQVGHHVDAAYAGVLLLPLTGGIVCGSAGTGRIISHTGHPTIMPVIGLSMTAGALLLMGLAPANPLMIAALSFICGLGMGGVMPTAQIVVQTAAGRASLGAATATTSFSRAVGSALGTALFGALVFALMPDTDVRASAQNGPAMLSAFHQAFLATAAVAALGAGIASRVPTLRI